MAVSWDGDRPCHSAVLLLASILWVSILMWPLAHNIRLTCLATCPQIPPPFSPWVHWPPTHILYFWFVSCPLPPPPGNSFEFNVLFALHIKSKQMLAVQLTQFILSISADVQSVSPSIKLWDLTFRVDQMHVFGSLQFEMRDRHEIIQLLHHHHCHHQPNHQLDYILLWIFQVATSEPCSEYLHPTNHWQLKVCLILYSTICTL